MHFLETVETLEGDWDGWRKADRRATWQKYKAPHDHIPPHGADIEHYVRMAEGTLGDAEAELGKIQNLLRADNPASIEQFTGIDRRLYAVPSIARKHDQRRLIANYQSNALEHLTYTSHYYDLAQDRLTDGSPWQSRLDDIAFRHGQLVETLQNIQLSKPSVLSKLLQLFRA